MMRLQWVAPAYHEEPSTWSRRSIMMNEADSDIDSSKPAFPASSVSPLTGTHTLIHSHPHPHQQIGNHPPTHLTCSHSLTLAHTHSLTHILAPTPADL